MPGTLPPVPPTARVIVFDGVCTLCSRCVRFVIRRDGRGLYRFATLQGATGAGLLLRHGLDPGDVRTFLLIKDGRSFLRSDAVLEIARDLGPVWRMLALLRVVPRSWRDALYDFVARRRYRWFGQEPACPTPDDQMRQRFLP